jgi:CBS domain-containing protein
MKAGDLMTRRLIRVRPETSVRDAVALMLRDRISGLPVVDEAGSLAGIVTESDFLHRAETGTTTQRPRWLELLMPPGRLAGEYVHTHGRKVGDVMTRDVVTVAESASLDELVRLMEHHRVKRLPVLDAAGRLVGLVSRADVLRAFLAHLRIDGGGGRKSDGEIEAEIAAALKALPWGPSASVAVTVEEGVVTFAGTISDDRERAALHVVAENTPGVRGVRDELALIEPLSGTLIEADARPFSSFR